MGYKKVNKDPPNVDEYIVDTKDDLKYLICSMGAQALVIADSAVYVKNSEGKWVEL